MNKLLIIPLLLIPFLLTGCSSNEYSTNVNYLSGKEAKEFIELLDKTATDCTTYCEDMTCEEFNRCQGCPSTRPGGGLDDFKKLIEKCENDVDVEEYELIKIN